MDFLYHAAAIVFGDGRFFDRFRNDIRADGSGDRGDVVTV